MPKDRSITRRTFLRGVCAKGASGLLLGAGLPLAGWAAQPPLPALPPAAKPKHIVVILADTLRWDFTGCYSTAHCQTPNIDRLADGGTVFENAFTVAPSSAPSYASLWSGLFPFQHGLKCNAMDLSAGIPHLPEAIHEAGYYTAGFVSNAYCGSERGFNRGWDEFFEQDKIGRFAWTFARELLPWLYRRDLQTTSTCVFVAYMDPHVPYSPPHMPQWLNITLNGIAVSEPCSPELADLQAIPVKLTPGENRLTLERVADPLRPEWKPKYRIVPQGWRGLLADGVTMEPGEGGLRSVTPHGAGMPYWIAQEFPCSFRLTNPSDSVLSGDLHFRVWRDYTADEARVLYPQCVEAMDYEIGNLLDAYKEQGVYDDTLFVFLSDHGEGLGDHGLVGHSEQVYDSLMHVPLIMRYPPLTATPRVRQMASLIDVAPTLRHMLGLEIPPGFGESLVPCMSQPGATSRPWVFGETYPPEARQRLSTLRTIKHSLIINKTKRELEYYGVEDDPNQLSNRAEAAPEHVDSLLGVYKEVFDQADPFAETDTTDGGGLYETLTTDELDELQAAGYL